MRACFIFWAVVAVAVTRGEEPHPILAYQRVRDRLLTDIRNLPRHTCVQTVRREVRKPLEWKTTVKRCDDIIGRRTRRTRELPLVAWDRLRLDVAIADAREIYSWAGAPRFEEGEIDDIVPGGPFGGGDFGPILGAIFSDASGLVTYVGTQTRTERTLLEYAFSVGHSSSQYRLKTQLGTVVTGWSGSFLIDPATNDISELTVVTSELPRGTGQCVAITHVAYQRVSIRGRQTLIPRDTRFTVLDQLGGETINIATYSGCREYTGESILRVAEDEVRTEERSEHTADPPPVPAGLPFECRIVTPIDSDTAAAGDPIEAVLVSSIHDGSGTELLAPGARIRGRLTRVTATLSPSLKFELGVRFVSIERNAVNIPFHAREDLTDNRNRGPLKRGSALTFPANIGNERIFVFHEKRVQLRQLDSRWVTTAP